jgi:heptaprenyl diphosphate synthase
MLSDAPAEAIELLDDLGLALGLAFQLSDDIMDVISTEEELHKQPGQDLKLGVYTLPVLYALQDGEAGRELTALLSEGPPSGDRLTRALEIIRADGSLDRAREAVSRSVRRARKLAGSLAPGPAREALEHIAEFLAVRCGAPS